MDFLTDPNVSYVLLVMGFLISILALLAPGTGFLEILALMMIALAGYGIINLPINLWAIIIMLLGGIPFLVLLRRTIKLQNIVALLSIAFVIGAAYLYRGKGWQPGVSIFLIIFLVPTTAAITWFISKKSLEAVRIHPAMSMNNLIGMTGQATSDIRGQGTIYSNGENWTAHSNVFIPAGKQVRVIARNGLILEVEPIEPELPK